MFKNVLTCTCTNRGYKIWNYIYTIKLYKVWKEECVCFELVGKTSIQISLKQHLAGILIWIFPSRPLTPVCQTFETIQMPPYSL